MRRRQGGRKSVREQKEDVNKALRYYAALTDKPVPFQHEIKPKRQYRKGASERPLERDVLAAILDALRHDRRVALVERQQSGVFKEGNRYIRVGTPGALDIKGMLHGGRMFEIEVKRPGEKP
jgi:hypothetical protein